MYLCEWMKLASRQPALLGTSGVAIIKIKTLVYPWDNLCVFIKKKSL
jgi:hypothetical protein